MLLFCSVINTERTHLVEFALSKCVIVNTILSKKTQEKVLQVYASLHARKIGKILKLIKIFMFSCSLKLTHQSCHL